jgi:hypothetical protein
VTDHIDARRRPRSGHEIEAGAVHDLLLRRAGCRARGGSAGCCGQRGAVAAHGRPGDEHGRVAVRRDRAYAGDDRDAVNIDYVDVAASSGTITSYEAEASANTLSGTARRGSNTGASGGQHVGFIGAGAGNSLRFNNVTVPTAGRYRVVVAYANAEVVGNHQYNNNIVDRGADISVNGGTSRRVYFRNTLSWTTFRTTVVDVDLVAGANTITFGNSASGYAPDIDLIRVAAPIA